LEILDFYTGRKEGNIINQERDADLGCIHRMAKQESFREEKANMSI
jgi:hypothetical protein